MKTYLKHPYEKPLTKTFYSSLDGLNHFTSRVDFRQRILQPSTREQQRLLSTSPPRSSRIQHVHEGRYGIRPLWPSDKSKCEQWQHSRKSSKSRWPSFGSISSKNERDQCLRSKSDLQKKPILSSISAVSYAIQENRSILLFASVSLLLLLLIYFVYRRRSAKLREHKFNEQRRRQSLEDDALKFEPNEYHFSNSQKLPTIIEETPVTLSPSTSCNRLTLLPTSADMTTSSLSLSSPLQSVVTENGDDRKPSVKSVPEQKPSSTALVEQTSTPASVPKQESASTSLPEQKLSSANSSKEKNSLTPSTEPTPLSKQVPEQKPPSTPSVEQKSLSKSVTEQKPASTSSLEQKALSTSSVEQKSLSKSVSEQKPASTSSVEQKSLSKSVPDQKPPSIPSVEQKPLSKSLTEQKPASTSSIEQKPPSASSVEQKALSKSVSEQKSASTSSMEQKSLSKSVPDQNSPSTPSVEQKLLSKSVPEQKPASTSSIEQKPPSTSSVEQKTLSKSVSEQKPASTSSVEQKALSKSVPEQKPAPTSSVEQKLLSKSVPESKPASTSSIEQKPPSTSSVEQKSLSKSASEQKPASKSSALQKSSPVSVVEQKPLKNKTGDEIPLVQLNTADKEEKSALSSLNRGRRSRFEQDSKETAVENLPINTITPPPVIVRKVSVVHENVIKDDFKSIEEINDAVKEVGLVHSQLIFGIDYTISNLETGRDSFQGYSLHHIQDGLLNPYQNVITIIGRTLERFDADTLIPAFGFGDRSTLDRKIFPLRPDGSYCKGFRGVLEAYNEITPKVRMSGPTNFAPLIREAIRIVKKTGEYHILVIVADGQVTNERQTKDAIVEASNYPLSIVMVGVGDGPWDMMEEFDDSLPTRQFDNFQFVNYNSVVEASANTDTAFALHALMEIPSQYAIIKKLGLLGNN